VTLGCRDDKEADDEDSSSATDPKQRHDVTAETQQFIDQVWPGLTVYHVFCEFISNVPSLIRIWY